MRASVRNFISADVDLDSFWPEDEGCFSFLLQALVGPEGAEGEESLEFLVCTPDYLKEAVSREGVIFGRSLVIVEYPNMHRILEQVKSRVERIEAPSWKEVGVLLARIGKYEFEDFS